MKKKTSEEEEESKESESKSEESSSIEIANKSSLFMPENNVYILHSLIVNGMVFFQTETQIDRRQKRRDHMVFDNLRKRQRSYRISILKKRELFTTSESGMC